MKEKTNVRVPILATQTEKDKWERVANKLGLNTSALIRLAVNTYCDSREAK